MHIPIIPFILVILGFMGSFIFSGTETAFIVAGRSHFKGAETGSTRFEWWLANKNTMLFTTLVGNNIANVAAATFSSSIFVYFFGKVGNVYSTFFVTVVTIVFCEMIPKSISYGKPEVISKKISTPLYLFHLVFYPVIYITSIISGVLTDTLNKLVTSPKGLDISELEKIVEEGEMELEEERNKLINNLLDFRRMKIFDVMTPIQDLPTISLEDRIRDAKEAFKQSDSEGVMVYNEQKQEFAGVLFLEDIWGVDDLMRVERYVSQIQYVPEVKKAAELFIQMEEEGINFTGVIDEHANVTGAVTLENLRKSVFAGIIEERKVEGEAEGVKEKVTEIENGFIVPASLNIDYMRELLEIDFPYGKYKSVGGFMLEMKREFPEKGESVEYNGWEFTLLEKEERVLKKIKVEKITGVG